MGQEPSFSENIDHLIEKSNMQSSERSFQKLPQGIEARLSHCGKDGADTMNVTSLSDMILGNGALKYVRHSHKQSQSSNIDIRRALYGENKSSLRDSDHSGSAYELDQCAIKSALERQVQEFMLSQQPVIQQQAQ